MLKFTEKLPFFRNGDGVVKIILHDRGAVACAVCPSWPAIEPILAQSDEVTFGPWPAGYEHFIGRLQDEAYKAIDQGLVVPGEIPAKFTGTIA